MAVPIWPTKLQIHIEFSWIACYFFNGSEGEKTLWTPENGMVIFYGIF